MITEAIVLAGGLGTRLKGVIEDIPKPMAPVAGKPFLDYIFQYLRHNGIQRIVLAVGYRWEVIKEHYGYEVLGMELVYAVEESPLGTGGGILNALQKTKSKACFLLNGDTFFQVDLNKLYKDHAATNAQLTLSLKAMTNFDRYGTVEIQNERITDFKEKKFLKEGLINGGVYVITKGVFEKYTPGERFSFEQDIMETEVSNILMAAHISNGYFIDIGIPLDYQKANKELPTLGL
jgi:D-glycero-alpha-D-manno-heptose 1-phosphate guanylyltransferase